MKTNLIQSKLKLILLTLLNVSALNSPAFAEYLIVDGISVSGSNKTYEADKGNWAPALDVSDGGSYTGTNITLSSTDGYFPGASVDNGSTLSLIDSTVTLNTVNGFGVNLTLESSATLRNVTIEAKKEYAYAVAMYSSSTLTLTDCNITTATNDNYSKVLFISEYSTVTASLNNNTLTGDIRVSATSTLHLTGSNGTVLTSNVNSREDSVANLRLSGSDTKIIGAATHDDTGTINLTIEDGTQLNQLTGNINTLTLQNGATLSSDDSNGALLLNGAFIAVTTDQLTLSDGTLIDYNDNALSLTGTLTIGDNILIDLSDATLEDNQAYTILDWSNADLTGTVNVESFTAKNLTPDMTGTFTIDGTQLTFHATAIPEPTTWFLLATGFSLLLLTARRNVNVQS
jgi:hypothetical protein